MEEEITLEEKMLNEIKELNRQLLEARMAAEHNAHVADENQLKTELRYRDGVIYGLKYALRCNGVSGGDIDR